MTTYTTVSFGYWVRRRRQALDLTQAGLARHVGCATVTISKIERDERRPSQQMAKLLAEQLEIPAAELQRFLSVASAQSSADQMPLSNKPVQSTAFEVPAPSAFSTNLPKNAAVAVRRTAEETAILHLLTHPDVRLVTLVGPGGAGKTHLAIQIANEATTLYKDGVCYVVLEAIVDPALVPAAIARALGLTGLSDTTALESVLAALEYKEQLLVLDNFEHLLAAVDVINTILQVAPGVTLLVTSRELLQLRWEHSYPLGPMTFPLSNSALTVLDANCYQAIQLFELRAQAIQPNFHLNSETFSTVAEICRALDGLPLAIELAAAQLLIFSLTSLLEELVSAEGSALDILQGVRPDVLPHHGSLRDAIAWSYGLLSTDEQRVFAQLSVFQGGFTLEAAEVIGGSVPYAVEVADRSVTRSVIRALVTKSLISSTVQPNGEIRFRLLATVREFGLGCLAATEEAENIHRIHAQWFAGLATAAEKHLIGPEQVPWLERLVAEAANLHEALRWSIAHEEYELAFTFGATLLEFWHRRGHLIEGWHWLQKLQDLPQDLLPLTLRAKTTLNAGIMAMLQGDYKESDRLTSASVEVARNCEDKSVLSYALIRLGRLRYGQNESAEAIRLLEEAIVVSQENEHSWELGFGQTMLGQCYRWLEQNEAALTFTKAGLEQFRTHGDYWGIAMSCMKVADVLVDVERLTEAEIYIKEGLKHSHALQDPVLVALGLQTWAEAISRQGHYTEAWQQYLKCLHLRWRLGDLHGSAAIVGALARIEIHNKQFEKAIRLGRAAAKAFEQIGGIPTRYRLDEVMHSARRALDQEAYELATLRADMCPLFEVIDELLSEPTS